MNKTIQAQGTRKRALARASLCSGSGKVIINGQLLEHYATKISRLRIMEPLILAENIPSTVDINVKVQGGGTTGFTDAIRSAIARVLVQHEPALKKKFDEYDRLLLVSDVRQNEVSKPNDSKPRDKRQKSYR